VLCLRFQFLILACVLNFIDVDNLVKFVLDSLSGAAYMDDNQVVSLITNKIYAEDPRISVTIVRLQNNYSTEEVATKLISLSR